MVLKNRRVDRDCPYRAAAIGGHFDHAAAGSGLNGAVRQFALQLLEAALHLLLLISAGLPGNHAAPSADELTATVTAGIHTFLYGHLRGDE